MFSSGNKKTNISLFLGNGNISKNSPNNDGSKISQNFEEIHKESLLKHDFDDNLSLEQERQYKEKPKIQFKRKKSDNNMENEAPKDIKKMVNKEIVKENIIEGNKSKDITLSKIENKVDNKEDCNLNELVDHKARDKPKLMRQKTTSCHCILF
jgi:hypothetical protein